MFLGVRGLEAESVVVAGNPTKDISTQARKQGCDLIAMLGQGDPTLGRGMLVRRVVDDNTGSSDFPLLERSREIRATANT